MEVLSLRDPKVEVNSRFWQKTRKANLLLALLKVIFSFPVKSLVNFWSLKRSEKKGGYKVREDMKLHVSVIKVDFLELTNVNI